MLEINSQEDLLNEKQSDTWNPSLSIDMVNHVDLSSGVVEPTPLRNMLVTLEIFPQFSRWK